MVRIFRTDFTPEEELRFSIVATLARMGLRRPLFRLIGRFRRSKDTYAFERLTINRARLIARSLDSNGLHEFLNESEVMLNDKTLA